MLTVSACGFALRGSGQAALSFDEMAIIQPAGYYPLADALTEVLQANGASVPDADTADQGYALALSPETLEQRTISINTRAGAGQYELILSVDATLYLDGELIGGPETITTRGNFYEDTANISGSNSARDLALEDMRRTMAEQMLRQLQALNL
ncbi:MAG: LPS assembly lipoprotein LptE [Pseudohongiella sp.]|uniref:LPS-assembly lipoprotein LptE n=1 Tax=Pseudohongiella sp. TaxID=1979412 RepID=UPI0034A02503